MKRILCFVLLLIFTLTIIAGCGQAKTPESSTTTAATAATTAASSSASAPETAQEDNSPITFTVFISDQNNAQTEDGFKSPVAQEIQKETGVTLNIEYPVGDSQQKVSLIAASGEFPDMMFVEGQRDLFVKQGAFLKLDDYIEKYGSNIKKMFGDNLKRLRYNLDDQSIYNLGFFADQKKMTPAYGFQVQWAVMKELGYPKMVTLQDYESVLKQYFEKHPTIDGKKTIPMSICAETSKFEITVANPSAYSTGKYDNGKWYIDPQTNKATVLFRLPETKEYFKWLNHMNDVGLLDPESFIQKYDQFLAKVGEGRVLGTTDADWDYQPAMDTLKTDGKQDRVFGNFPVQMTDKTKAPNMYDPGFTGSWGMSITKSCKDPVRAFKFLDYLASEKTQILLNWGIEGVHYNIVDGKRKLLPEFDKMQAEDWTSFSKTTGIGHYLYPWPCYGWGSKDSSGQMYDIYNENSITSSYTDSQKEGLKAYGATLESDLFPPASDFPIPPYGYAWQIGFPAESDSAMILKKYVDLYHKRAPEAVLCKPSEFDAAWDKFQKEIDKLNVTKAEDDFTKFVADRVKMWGN